MNIIFLLAKDSASLLTLALTTSTRAKPLTSGPRGAVEGGK